MRMAAMLRCFGKIQAVFDLTVGSGALMEACMGAGVLYHGLCPDLS